MSQNQTCANESKGWFKKQMLQQMLQQNLLGSLFNLRIGCTALAVNSSRFFWMSMTHSSVIQQASKSPREQGTGGRAQPSTFGTLAKLACKCSVKNDVDFLIKKDRIVCASCGRQVLCAPPLIGIYMAACDCCASAAVKSTFVLDTDGIYTCTWCGRTR